MRNKGLWKKGQSGNPNGRPPKPEAEMLREALELCAKKKNKHLINHAVELAYTDTAVLIAILKKILPDKIASDQTIRAFLYEGFKDKTDEEVIKEVEDFAININRIKEFSDSQE